MVKIEAKPKERYEVEWCYEMPVTECGDADLDRAKYKVQHVDSFDTAIAFAKKLLRDKRDAFGSVSVEFQRRVLDVDILEHEGRTVFKWECVKVLHVDDLDFAYAESDLENPH